MPLTSPVLEVMRPMKDYQPSAVGPSPARGAAGQQLDPLVDRPHRPHVEPALACRLHDLLVEHEVLDVRRRDQHALRARETLCLARGVEPLDLARDTADGLHVAVLVDRPGHGDALGERKAGEGREQRVELLDLDAAGHRDP